MNYITMVVAKKLNLNVLWLVQESFDKDGTVAESRLRFGDGAFKGILEFLLFPYDTHTATTATKGCLDDDWEAKFVGKALDILVFLDGPGCAGHAGNVGLGGQFTSGDLVSQAINSIRAGADKLEHDSAWRRHHHANEASAKTYHNACGLDLSGKIGILREETITRVYHVDSVLDSNFDDLVGSQVGLDWPVLSRLANDVGFVGLLPVHTESILATVDGDGLQRQFVGRAEDANGNFTTVGD